MAFENGEKKTESNVIHLSLENIIVFHFEENMLCTARVQQGMKSIASTIHPKVYWSIENRVTATTISEIMSEMDMAIVVKMVKVPDTFSEMLTNMALNIV